MGIHSGTDVDCIPNRRVQAEINLELAALSPLPLRWGIGPNGKPVMEQQIIQPEVPDTRTRRKKRPKNQRGILFYIKTPVHGCEGRRPASDWLLQTVEDLILDCRWTMTHPKFNSSVWRAQTLAPSEI